jgi:hypothetical protein
MRYSQPFNLLGLPAAVVPVSYSPEGLPIGVQVIGRPCEEELVLSVAATIEAQFGFQEPPMKTAAADAAGQTITVQEGKGVTASRPSSKRRG